MDDINNYGGSRNEGKTWKQKDDTLAGGSRNKGKTWEQKSTTPSGGSHNEGKTWEQKDDTLAGGSRNEGKTWEQKDDTLAGGSRNKGKTWAKAPLNIPILDGDNVEEIRYLYRITDLQTNETYVGQHKARYKNFIYKDSYYGSGTLIKKAVKYYGKQRFKKEIIVAGHFSKNLIDMMEILAIADERANGGSQYNISKGGSGGPYGGAGGDTSQFIDYKSQAYRDSIRRGHQSFIEKNYKGNNDEWRQDCKNRNLLLVEKDPNHFKSKGTTGYHFSEEQKQHITDSHLGEKNNMYGKHHTEDSKEKIRQAFRVKTIEKYKELLIEAHNHDLSTNEKKEFAIKFQCTVHQINKIIRDYKENF